MSSTDEGDSLDSFRLSDPDLSLLRQWMDTVEDVVFILGPEGSILMWNARVRQVTGYTDDEIARMRAHEFVPDREQPYLRRKIVEVLETGSAHVEAHYLTKDGRQIPYEFTGSLLEREDQLLICGVGRDVTRRRRSRRLLELMQGVAQASNQAGRLEAALQTAVDSVCEKMGWPVGHAYRPAEGSTDEVVPTGIWNRGCGDEFDEFRSVTRRSTFAVGEGLPGRVVDSGDAVWIVDVTRDDNFPRAEVAVDIGVRGAFAFPVSTEERIVAVLEFFSEEPERPDSEVRDAMQSVGVQLGRVAEREEALRELEASEERYRTLTETAVDGIVVAGEDGRIIEWNEGAREIFGYRKSEALGERVVMLMPERYRERHREGMERAARTGEGRLLGRTVELEGLDRDGEEFPIELALSTWSAGETRYFTAIIRDVSDRKRMERELVDIQERERRRIGQEIHDSISSQLTGVTMFTRGIADDLREGESVSPEDLEEVVEQLKEAGEEARRISRGLKPVTIEKGGLSSALERLVDKTERQSSIDCSLVRDDSIPELDQEVATHLYRIAQEAVQNAVSHAEADCIEVRLSTGEESLILSVIDDGRGFSEEPGRPEGLGLSSMRYRADLIGGRMEVSRGASGGARIRCVVSRTAV